MRNGRLALLILLAFACAHQPPATAPAPATSAAAAPGEQTRRYTVLMSTNTAGTQLVTTRGDEITVEYEYNDRGRGPKTHTVIRLDERGVPLSMLTTGNDYLKTQVEERLTVENGRATWSNTAEKGSSECLGVPASSSEGTTTRGTEELAEPRNCFYVSMYGPPEEAAILARALLRNGGRMAILPAGEALIRKVDETTLRGTRVTAYEISGLGFTPFEILLDDDLNFFGSVSSWSSTIREGFEHDVKPLIEAQDARAAARLGEIAKRLTRVPTMRRLTVFNARIFDPLRGTLSAPTSIHVEGNRIARIGGEQERSGADVIDAGGKVVLPGLWDMHTHLGDTDGLLNIAAGVTSVRDLGNDSDFIVGFKKKIEDGESVGPRIVLAGLVDGPGPFKGPTNILAGNEEEARKAVDFLAGRGYEGLKIYSSIKPELVPVLTTHAHERGLRVSGHIPAGMRAEQAVDAGYDEIQHANMLFLNFIPDVTDTRTPARFTEVGRRGADLDLQSADVRAFIAKLRDRNIVVDPTVTIFETMFTARAGTMSPAYAMIADRLPPTVRRYFLTGGLPVPEGMDERYRASYQRMLDLVGELHRSGVKIVAGTDALPGFALHRELELYARAGIPNAEVLRIATLTPAEILKRDRDLGTIEPGKLADFIIIDGNPLTDISDIRRVVTTVKDGVVYDAKALYAEVGVR